MLLRGESDEATCKQGLKLETILTDCTCLLFYYRDHRNVTQVSILMIYVEIDMGDMQVCSTEFHRNYLFVWISSSCIKRHT